MYCACEQTGGDAIMKGNNFLYSSIKTAPNLLEKVPLNSAAIVCQHERFGGKTNFPVDSNSSWGQHVRTSAGSFSFCLFSDSAEASAESELLQQFCCPWARSRSFFFFFLFFFLMSSSSPHLKIGRLDFLLVSPSHPWASSGSNIFYTERTSPIFHSWQTDLRISTQKLLFICMLLWFYDLNLTD